MQDNSDMFYGLITSIIVGVGLQVGVVIADASPLVLFAAMMLNGMIGGLSGIGISKLLGE